jgi:hypothetical protein
LNLLLYGFGGFRRDALAEFLSLEQKIRPLGDSFVGLSFGKHLAARCAPAEAID